MAFSSKQFLKLREFLTSLLNSPEFNSHLFPVKAKIPIKLSFQANLELLSISPDVPHSICTDEQYSRALTLDPHPSSFHGSDSSLLERIYEEFKAPEETDSIIDADAMA